MLVEVDVKTARAGPSPLYTSVAKQSRQGPVGLGSKVYYTLHTRFRAAAHVLFISHAYQAASSFSNSQSTSRVRSV